MIRYKKPTGDRLIRALAKNGYEIKKFCKGSHVFLIDPNNKDSYAVIPNTRKTLKVGLLEDIRKNELKISEEKFMEILRDC
jgi:predicted RNA binding protein YcfA (HicA-like mRNA interferase family)